MQTASRVTSDTEEYVNGIKIEKLPTMGGPLNMKTWKNSGVVGVGIPCTRTSCSLGNRKRKADGKKWNMESFRFGRNKYKKKKFPHELPGSECVEKDTQGSDPNQIENVERPPCEDVGTVPPATIQH